MRRLAAELSILGLMTATAAYDPNLFAAAAGFVILPLPFIQWALWVYLYSKVLEAERQGLYLQPLVDRTNDARTLALGSTAAGLGGLFVVGRQLDFFGPIPREWYLVIVAFSLVMLVVPALAWLRTWRTVWMPQLRHRQAQRQDNDRVSDHINYIDPTDIPPPQ